MWAKDMKSHFNAEGAQAGQKEGVQCEYVK